MPLPTLYKIQMPRRRAAARPRILLSFPDFG